MFTLTGNLLAETSAIFPFPKVGDTVRAIGESTFQVGGKGVNVSKAAHRMGIYNHAIVFPAGYVGERCIKYLREMGFCDIISEQIAGETRMGLICKDAVSGIETTFLGSDVPVPSSALYSTLAKVSKTARSNDAFAICGSFAGWQRQYANAIKSICKERELLLCIDTYGKPLADMIKCNCALLKINRKEFFGNIADIEDDGTYECFVEAFERSRKKVRAKYFAVSDGSNNSLFAEIGRESFALKPPICKNLASTTGCGDIMFACLIGELFKKKTDFAAAAKRALAWASAEAALNGIAELKQSVLDKILNS